MPPLPLPLVPDESFAIDALADAAAALRRFGIGRPMLMARLAACTTVPRRTTRGWAVWNSAPSPRRDRRACGMLNADAPPPAGEVANASGRVSDEREAAAVARRGAAARARAKMERAMLLQAHAQERTERERN